MEVRILPGAQFMEQLLVHLFADYYLQSDWMALNKNKKTLPCFVHCIIYTLPFLILTRSAIALLVIFGTHFLIDRFSLAKYLIWAKNHLNPSLSYYPFDKCKITGFYDDWDSTNVNGRPKFISTWLYIISDNTLHLLINFLALKYL